MLKIQFLNSFSKKVGFFFDNVLPKLRGLFFVVGSFFMAIGCNFPFNQFLIDPFSLMTLVNLKRLKGIPGEIAGLMCECVIMKLRDIAPR